MLIAFLSTPFYLMSCNTCQKEEVQVKLDLNTKYLFNRNSTCMPSIWDDFLNAKLFNEYFFILTH